LEGWFDHKGRKENYCAICAYLDDSLLGNGFGSPSLGS
jgi:hypothetical protein